MKICIIGVGNIGMRYVQGITKEFPAAELVLVDCDARLKELAALDLENVQLLNSLGQLRGSIDIFVVATSCEPRLSIYKECLDLDPKHIILEKYLFASRQEFDECLALARVPTFVNQWLYGSKAFDCIFEEGARSVELIGSGWGLACNAVHWIDVFQRHLKIENLSVGRDTAVSNVFPSKRAGYEEIDGELCFEDRDSDKKFRLIDKQGDGPNDVLTIRVDDKSYQFDYKRITEGEKVLSVFPYFSELIGGIVGDISGKGSCSLPLLEDSVAQHLLIEDVLATLDCRPKIT